MFVKSMESDSRKGFHEAHPVVDRRVTMYHCGIAGSEKMLAENLHISTQLSDSERLRYPRLRGPIRANPYAVAECIPVVDRGRQKRSDFRSCDSEVARERHRNARARRALRRLKG